MKKLYAKPKGMKYTDMAKYIDEHAYDEVQNEEVESKIYIYLYLISDMLAHKGKLFTRPEYYEDFAVYMATNTYLRLKNSKQFELKDDGTYKQDKIKSILNYIKATIRPRKIDFEQQFYSQAIQKIPKEDDEESVVVDTCYSLSQKMYDSVETANVEDFNECLGDIIPSIKKYLKRIPYEGVEWNNIYLSCLLTFLSSITLPTKERERLRKSKMSIELKEKEINEIYRQESSNSTILFHLDESMSGYIHVLTQEVKHVIAKDLSKTIHKYISSEYDLNSLVLAEVNGNYVDYDDYGGNEGRY